MLNKSCWKVLMSDFLNTYSNRKTEILNFIKFIEYIEYTEIKGSDTPLYKFLHSDIDLNSITYQSLINILKSNLSLMLYNILEYSVSGLLEELYTEISLNKLSYSDVSEKIQAIWHETQFKSAKDPNSNFNTLLKKSKQLLDFVTTKEIMCLSPRDTIPGGNLDGKILQKLFDSHGIKINLSSVNYRPDILENIKTNRNNLAHGSVSFADALMSSSIADLKIKADFLIKFLDELIASVQNYTNTGRYRK